MNFPAGLFPLPFLLVLDFATLAALCVAAWRFPWRQLTAAQINAWLGACVAAMVLWTLKYDARPGLSYHLLGMTVLTLMMGPALAMLAAALVIAVACLMAGGAWQPLGLDWLTSGVLPVALTWASLRLIQRRLPCNYFVYLFLNAFLTGGLAMAAAGLAGVAVLGAFGVYAWDGLLSEALPYYLLLAWSEAFLTGLLMAILIVYRPRWVASFDDARYLKN
ncbi:MAG: energy-coupling factor ABC transporter permease [Paludibacterium sp.]|uniref:energy-coupling factor ABC transporter permease n=1 Tax=Paludibacterium sp. TaxID=1917523 RepID=UPI0025E1A72F|nr:energy-coupling factor ABC transporter permease [Paludibacterium sp.]MBV8049496.1 energy-coupling factor ABC transporter permease [Paludibacterium sp.]MBV8646243.1 energy-coupling factor ABC transporter permease [Paludibacterium sp.]